MSRFVFGDVFDVNGSRINSYSTYCDAFPRIIDRGVENSDYRNCSGCGATWLDHHYQPRIYALSSDFSERHVRQDYGGSLLVTETVAKIIVERWFKKIRLVRLELVDKPPDGIRLPEDPDWLQM
jgi:hypothetical protein